MENSEMIIPDIVLNSSKKMPVIGFGTMALPHPPPEQLIETFLDAIKIGYRHFDTAACYGSEEALGRAIAKAIELGLIKNRDELFITSKLWCTDVDADRVLPALKTTLGKLGLDYLDLYLVHWPVKIKQQTIDCMNFSKEDLAPIDIHANWKAMEECYKLGLAKSVGVSNFSCEKLTELLRNATIPPAVNQVEMSAGWQQKKLLPFCKEKNIHVSAWSPLGAYGALWGTNAVMENSILKDIATLKCKTVAQVALRWIYEQGGSVIVKSFNKERMKENIKIFDWELTKEEIEQIKQIPQRRTVEGEYFVHPNGPYKSLEELWDGDI